MAEPPRRVRDALSEVTNDDSMNDAVQALAARAPEFDSPLAAKLTGVALNPAARLHFDRALDAMWDAATVPTSSVPEIVVGGGLHAAIYCAVRVREGHPKPLVIEAKERVGGAFAASQLPAFYLNSINRPGVVGIPGREEGLNYLPGAIIQPADLGIAEYQVNTDIAFAIRANLALYAKVLTGTKIERQLSQGEPTGVLTVDGTRINADRVIWATGLGAPTRPEIADGKSLMDYMEFLGHLDQPFPFQGIKSVAVVGAGDSGRTVIEALVGQGPSQRMSVASLDWVDKIDWYGVSPDCMTRDAWASNNRSRYKGIARVLPTEAGGASRVTPLARRAEQFGTGFDGAYVDGARYDLVILATGFAPQRVGAEQDVSSFGQFSVGGRVVARAGSVADSQDAFIIGPAAKLETNGEANVLGPVLENTAAVWRYADRTASLAMSLPATGVEEVTEPDEPKPKRRRLMRAKKVKTEKLDKSDPRNWEAGDRLSYNRWATNAVAAVISKVSNGKVYIDRESTVEGEAPIPRRETAINVGGWTYVGEEDNEVDRSLYGYGVGDRIQYEDGGSKAKVISINGEIVTVREESGLERELGQPGAWVRI